MIMLLIVMKVSSLDVISVLIKLKNKQYNSDLLIAIPVSVGDGSNTIDVVPNKLL